MDDEERQAWIAGLKRRYGLRCAGDEKEAPETPAWQDYVPEWPALPRDEQGVPYRYFSLGPALVSPDGGEHWYEVPDDVPLSEFLSSLP